MDTGQKTDGAGAEPKFPVSFATFFQNVVVGWKEKKSNLLLRLSGTLLYPPSLLPVLQVNH